MRNHMIIEQEYKDYVLIKIKRKSKAPSGEYVWRFDGDWVTSYGSGGFIEWELIVKRKVLLQRFRKGFLERKALAINKARQRIKKYLDKEMINEGVVE